MDYSQLTKEQLIEMIKQLKRLNHQLLSDREQDIKLEYPWTGNLGHWYWEIPSNTVTFNELKVTNLGYDKDEIPEKVNYQFFTDKLHPDDYDKTMNAMRDHLYGNKSVYEVKYRIRTKDGQYRWYYDRGKITQYDESGEPLFLAGIVFDITQEKESQHNLQIKNELLSQQASMDSLTKVANHRTLSETLNREVSDYKSTGKPISIVLFDLDDFKQINDTKGHIYGDKVLIDVAQILQTYTRETDLVGRYGGEEFLVIFPNTEESTARQIAERIRQAIENHDFGNDIKITISAGVKSYSGEDVHDFIDSVDVKLYQAKNQGKNVVI